MKNFLFRAFVGWYASYIMNFGFQYIDFYIKIRCCWIIIFVQYGQLQNDSCWDEIHEEEFKYTRE
jgi:hypothetical protein